MGSPSNTDRALSIELAQLRHQVLELQQALANAGQDHILAQGWTLGAAQVGTWEWEASTNRVILSLETERIFGLLPGSFDGTYQGFIGLVHPEDRQRFSAAIATAVKDRTFYRIEHRIITPSGTIRWVACRGRAMCNGNKPVSGMVGTVGDITACRQSDPVHQDIQETLKGHVRERAAESGQTVPELKKEIERRQQAESALRASELCYQSLYEQNPFMYFTLTPDGTVLSVNRFGADQLRYSQEDLIGQSIMKMLDLKDQQAVLSQLKACVATPYSPLQWEVQKIRSDGTRLWVKERARAIHDQTGRIFVLVVCEDITDRRRAETQLHETSHLLHTLIEDSAFPLVRLDREGQVISWNQAATRLFGWSEEEVLGRELPYVQPGEEAMADALWQAGINGELTGPLELRRRRKDGQILDLLLWPVCVHDEFGQLSMAVGLYVDLSDLRRAEEAKVKSEARLRSFLDALDDLAFEFDQEGRYLNVWTRNEDKLLLPKQDLIGKHVTDVFGPEAGAHYLSAIRQVIDTGKTATVEYIVPLEGTLRHFAGTLTLIPASGEHRATVGCIVRDITESRLAEEQIRESEMRWRALYEHAGVGIAQLDLDGRFLRVNSHLCGMLGYSSEAMFRTRFQELTHPDDLAVNLDYLDELLAGKRPSYSMEKRCRRSDNTWTWVDLTVSLVRTASGNPAYFIAVVQHIDARKQAETHLRKSEQAIRSLHEATSHPGLTFDQRIQTVLEIGCRRFHLPIGVVTGVRGDQLELTHIWPPHGSFTPGMRMPLPQTYCSETLKANDVVCVDQASASAWSNHPGYENLGLECYIGTTLIDEDRPHGTICFMGPEPYLYRFSQADKDFLRLMARWVSGELLRRDSEQALKEQEALLRAVIETATDAIFMKDGDGCYRFINSAGALVIGKSTTEIIGKNDDAIFPPATAQRLMADDQKVFSGTVQRRFEEILPMKGEPRTFYSIKTPHRDRTGRIVGLVGVARDMTHVKRAEQALRLTQIAVDRSADLVFWIDKSARFLYVNDASCQRLGYTHEELLRMTVADLDPDRQMDRLPEHWEALRQSGAIRFE